MLKIDTSTSPSSPSSSSSSSSPRMTSPRQWWRRAASVIKDRRSLFLTRLASSSSSFRNPELEVAVIRATNHDDRFVDYKNSGRVFAWARVSPSFHLPLMWALTRRAVRTRSWPVALKVLMLTHGLLMRADSLPTEDRMGRLPFDLSDFRDRSSSRAKAWGFSAFIRAYFNFLDDRSVFATFDYNMVNEDERLDRVEKLQSLLELLMQIRPYADGMEVGLILEAMDCVLIEIFEVYSQICNGIARFLLGILGSGSSTGYANLTPEVRRRRGIIGMRVLKRAHEQSSQLSAFFDLCRGLGVLNAAELPEVEKIPEEDILDLERLVMNAVQADTVTEMETPVHQEMDASLINQEMEALVQPNEEEIQTVGKWVVFEEDQDTRRGNFFKMENDEGYFRNNLVEKSSPSWASWTSPGRGVSFGKNGNLIELV